MNFSALPVFCSPIFTIMVEEDTEELKKSNYRYITSSAQGGVSNENASFRTLEYHPRVKNILMSYWKKLNDDILFNECDFMITTSWITKTDTDQLSQFHSHKNSYYSGVYYYDEYDEESGLLVFSSPIRDNFDFYPHHHKKDNVFNSLMWDIKPKKNMLVFFPSYVSHQVYQHKSNTVRHSLAFNIVPTGRYGMADSYIDTDWYSKDVNHKSNTKKSNSGTNFLNMMDILNKNSPYKGGN